jgi:hypothetical protein
MPDKPQADDAQPTQQTHPKQGEPATIPVPKREDFERVLGKAISGSPKRKKPPTN